MVCKVRSVCNMRTVLFLCNKTTKLNKREKKTFQSSSHSDEMFRWLSVTHALFNLHRVEKLNGLTGGFVIVPSMLCVAPHNILPHRSVFFAVIVCCCFLSTAIHSIPLIPLKLRLFSLFNNDDYDKDADYIERWSPESHFGTVCRYESSEIYTSPCRAFSPSLPPSRLLFRCDATIMEKKKKKIRTEHMHHDCPF